MHQFAAHSRGLMGFAGAALVGALFGTDGLTLTPQELTIASLVMGFLTAVTVAIITAISARRGRLDAPASDPLEEWALNRLLALERENQHLRERLWQHERDDPAGPGT